MKNFWTLFRYEMRKIWKRPLLWGLLALLSFFLANESKPFTPDYPPGTYILVEKDGSETTRSLSFLEVFRLKREAAHALDGQKMDESFFQALRETMSYPQMSAPDFHIDSYIFRGVPPIYITLWRYLELTPDAYYHNNGGVLAYLATKAEVPDYGDLTDEELEYWSEMEENVELPYTFYDTAGMLKFAQTIYYAELLLPLVVGVCLCVLFPRDRRERLDGVVFSAKHGRGRLGAVKLAAGAVSAVAVAAILFCSVLGTCLFFHGICLDAPIQLYRTSSFPITVGQELLLTFLALALYSLLSGGLVMLVSLVALDSIAGLAAALVPVLIDLFWSGSDAITPLRMFEGKMFQIDNLVKIGGHLFNYLQATLFVLSVGAVLFLVLCGLFWRQWTVSGR